MRPASELKARRFGISFGGSNCGRSGRAGRRGGGEQPTSSPPACQLSASRRLADFGACYGDLPAHDGLWESAAATADDLLARLAVVPLVLEARGLDVTPEMAATLDRVGDPESAAVLRRIYRDEIDHVAAGVRWFDELCRARGLIPDETFQQLVPRYFKGELKPPFNHEARAAAGFPARYYEPLLRGGVPPLRE